MPSNPFEPPRTADLDGDDTGAPVISGDALQELAAAARWVRRLSRVTVLSIAIEVLSVLSDLARPLGFAQTAGSVIGAVVSTTILILFLAVLRRYAAASGRVREGSVGAVGQVITVQASYLKLAGTLTLIAMGLIIFALASGIGSGRLLSWVRS